MENIVHPLFFHMAEWKELDDEDRHLLAVAIETRNGARAGVSHYKVGAAIRSTRKTVYAGCNIEDLTHNGTIHAETCALGAMMAVETDSLVEVVAIALNLESVNICIPPERKFPDITEVVQITETICGHCRTILSQYQPKEKSTKVLALQANGQILITTLDELYPLGFRY